MPFSVGDLIRFYWDGHQYQAVLKCTEVVPSKDTEVFFRLVTPSKHSSMLVTPRSGVFPIDLIFRLTSNHCYLVDPYYTFLEFEISNQTTGWRKVYGSSHGLQQAIAKAYENPKEKERGGCSRCFLSSLGKSTGVEPGSFMTPCSTCRGSGLA